MKVVIKVKTKDNKVFEFDEPVARMSGLLSTKLDEWAAKSEGNRGSQPSMVTIPEKHVTGKVIEEILKWCHYHASNPADDIFDDDDDDDEGTRYGLQLTGRRLRWHRRFVWIPDWDKRFLSGLDQSTLLGMITAANYLKIKRLLSISSQMVANMMRGKSPEAIRQMFNIKNDIDPFEGDCGDDDEIQFIGSDHSRTGRGGCSSGVGPAGTPL